MTAANQLTERPRPVSDDWSDDFLALFQNVSHTYSCGYFDPPDLSLQAAELAKIDLSLDKLGLQPGMTLLDVGCGWAATMRRAIEKYDVDVIGLTLSEDQYAYSQQLLDSLDTGRTGRVLLQHWEEFDQPVDRIVSVEAFERFGAQRYDDFFARCFDILPDDGRMTIQSSTGDHRCDRNDRGTERTFETSRFVDFMLTEIFPGGHIPTVQMMVERGERAGFVVEECLSLLPHYLKTLTTWADTLEINKDKAVAITSEGVYHYYLKYLRGCRYCFADEGLDVNLVTYSKPTGADF